MPIKILGYQVWGRHPLRR